MFLLRKTCEAACLNRYCSGDIPRSVFIRSGFFYLWCVSLSVSKHFLWLFYLLLMAHMGIPATRIDAFVIWKFFFFPLFSCSLHSHCIEGLCVFSRGGGDESFCLGEGWSQLVLSSVYLQGALGRRCEK